ncbi:MAG: hypothetical protein SGCHY_000894, partial [Lobulomycetales sp.]
MKPAEGPVSLSVSETLATAISITDIPLRSLEFLIPISVILLEDSLNGSELSPGDMFPLAKSVAVSLAKQESHLENSDLLNN